MRMLRRAPGFVTPLCPIRPPSREASVGAETTAPTRRHGYAADTALVSQIANLEPAARSGRPPA
jgi:hypothetical protein